MKLDPLTREAPISVIDVIKYAAKALSIKEEYIEVTEKPKAGQEEGNKISTILNTDCTVCIQLTQCYRARILGKEIKFIRGSAIINVSSLKEELQRLDPKRLP